MNPLDRRGFLGLSALGVGSLMAADPETAPPPRLLGPPAPPVGGRDTLFLTYSGDPTTSVTIQWIDKPDPATDATIHHARAFTFPPLDGGWTATKTTTAPFPLTPLTRYRANLTGLTPGTEYRFRIGPAGVSEQHQREQQPTHPRGPKARRQSRDTTRYRKCPTAE